MRLRFSVAAGQQHVVFLVDPPDPFSVDPLLVPKNSAGAQQHRCELAPFRIPLEAVHVAQRILRQNLVLDIGGANVLYRAVATLGERSHIRQHPLRLNRIIEWDQDAHLGGVLKSHADGSPTAGTAVT